MTKTKNQPPLLRLRVVALQVAIQAYIMWEKAGRPDGADFSNDARSVLKEQLQRGTAVEVPEARTSISAMQPIEDRSACPLHILDLQCIVSVQPAMGKLTGA